METKGEIIFDSRRHIVKYNLVWFFTYNYAMLILAFISCVILTILLNVEPVENHCKFKGSVYLPSVSSAIDKFKLQKYIWHYCISLHCSIRTFVILIYFKFYMAFPSVRNCVHVFTLFDFIENFSLLFLSTMSISDHYELHCLGYKIFVCSSQIYMMLKIYITYKIKNDPGYCSNIRHHIDYFKFRKRLWAANLYFVFLAILTWHIHISICDNRFAAYIMFVLSEYIVVLINALFHVINFFETRDPVMALKNGGYRKAKSKPS